MDIGTAKPTAAERGEVRHHCLDLAEPSEDFTVVRYRAEAESALADIEARQAAAVLVGGTGLYLRAVLDRLEPPGQWPAVRRSLEAERDTRVLYERLRDVDPAAASKMEPTNRRRIIRALEVCIGSTRPFSSFGPGLDVYPPCTVAQFGLRWARPVLAARIEQRFAGLMTAGFLAEVEALARRPGGLSRTAAQALGYRELLAHLDGRVSLDAAVAEAVARTRRFAVRQDRWFRRDPRVRWIDVHDDPLEAVPRLEEELVACA